MKPVQILVMAVLALVTAAVHAQGKGSARSSLLDHEVRLLGSEDRINLQDTYGGRVVLIVNTASRCAFTDQYAGLEDLYAAYRERGLVVLGFPSSDFGNQELAVEAEIKDFCRLTYGVKFPMFAKSRVSEGGADPLFRTLGEAAGRYPQWNFHKYLVDRDGNLVDNYLSFVSPQNRGLIEAIEAHL